MDGIIKENKELWNRLISESGKIDIVDEAIEIMIHFEETLKEEEFARIFLLAGWFIEIIYRIDKALFPLCPASIFIVKDIFIEDGNNKNQERPIASYAETKKGEPNYLIYLPRLIDYIRDPKRQLKIICAATKVGIHEVRHRIQHQYPQLELFTLEKINDIKKRLYEKKEEGIALFFEKIGKEVLGEKDSDREQDADFILVLSCSFFKVPNLSKLTKEENPLLKILKLNASNFLAHN